MKKFHIDKSVTFLIIIMLVVIVTAGILIFAMQPDPIADALKNDPLYKVLIILEDEGSPLMTNVLIYYPESRRAALFDIPGETGLIIGALGRVDRIDALYVEKGIAAYTAEIEKLLGVTIPFHIVMSMNEFSALTDLLGGLKVFIPSPVDVTSEDGAERWLLPSGAVTLDGDKVRTYLSYISADDQESSVAERRQNAMVAFIKALGDNASRIFVPRFVPAIDENIRSNLKAEPLNRMLEEIARADAERLLPQRITGSLREVDGQMLLFPLYDGQLIKDIVKQATGSLASSGDTTHDRIYAIEILNGTGIQGLARNTSILYQSFGYDVMNVGNADSADYMETIIVDHIGNQAVAKNLGELIKCTRFKSTEVNPDGQDYSTDSLADFTVILGKDFDGRYVK